jgi:tRNA threonylcarbamoyladenosine biosynthesis protein TsaB
MPAHLQLLALDTSTDTMSIAVAGMHEGVPHVWTHTGAGGAQASATLIPAIMQLMGRAGLDFGDLDVLAFGCGPGAFTGLRTACSVAQGLAFGARVPLGSPALQVLPVDTLLALAEQARSEHVADGQPLRVLAMLDARMDEIYTAAYAFDGQRWTQQQECQLVHPEHLAWPSGWPARGFLLAGNVFAAYGERLPVPDGAPRRTVLPSATAMVRLVGDLLAQGLGVAPEQALPTYVRDKVAQTTSERAAAKASTVAASA